MIYELTDIIRYNKPDGLKFKNSIAEEYISKNNYNSGVNFPLLKEIVEDRANEPEENVISIHVRLGDILSYVKYARYLPNFIEIIMHYGLNKKFNKCNIYYGNHLDGKCSYANHEKSIFIIEMMMKKLNNIGIKSKIISRSADEDFVALSTSLCYVCGIRGFSWLSASINPNLVYWDAQNPPYFDWVLDSSQKPLLNQGYKYYISQKKS